MLPSRASRSRHWERGGISRRVHSPHAFLAGPCPCLVDAHLGSRARSGGSFAVRRTRCGRRDSVANPSRSPGRRQAAARNQRFLGSEAGRADRVVSDRRPSPSAHVTAEAAGLTLAADVLNLVPFADMGIAVADIRGGGLATSWRMGGQLGLGIDYLLSRHLVTSLLARVDYFPFRLAGGHDAHPTQASLALYLGRAF